MNKISKTTSTVYAVLLICGGIMGFVKAHSTISLLTGITSGVLILILLKQGEKKAKSSYDYITALSLLLGLFFGYRFAMNNAFMPGGLMLMLSTITFSVVGFSGFQQNKQKS